MKKKSVIEVVHYMSASMRFSFFIVCSLLALSACSSEAPTTESKTQQTLTKPLAYALDNETQGTTIYRDKYGVPHVVSDSNYGAYFGYGYAVATDRLFQMEVLRRTAEGRVAEAFGAKYLELDKHIRTGYDHRAVSRQLKELNTQDREVLEAYAAGFSKRVDEVLSDQTNLLPKEFTDFGFLPQTWNSYDVAMIFVGSIIHRYSDFNSELDNLALLTDLTKSQGLDKAKKIFDASKWLVDPSSPTTVPRTVGSNLNSALNKTKTAETSNASIAANQLVLDDIMTQRVILDDKGHFLGTNNTAEMQIIADKQIARHGFTGPEFHAASNFWSLNSNKLSDADGALVNGPQFGFGLPSYVYAIGLHGGDFDVVGNTLLGLPSMLFSHNKHVSWGSTAGLSDQVDVYREQLVSDKPEHYHHDGKDKVFERWTEVIKVKGEADVVATARRSVHGMVQSIDTEAGIAYSRARAWEGAELQTLMAWINLAKETSLDGVQDRLSKVAANINFYYMDTSGNIGYTHGGRYPLREATHDPRIPADGSGSQDWLGFRPYSDNPSVRNPAQDYIVNWNNRPAAGWQSIDLWTYTWSKADRSVHIVDELNSIEKMSTDDVWAITERVSYDDVSATFLFPYLVKAISSKANNSNAQESLLTDAFDTLNNWDKEWRLEENGHYGAAELITETWTKQLFERVLKDDIGENKYPLYAATNNPNNPLGPSMVSSVGVKVILRNLMSLETGADTYDFFNGEDPEHVILKSFNDAINLLVKDHGQDMSTWSLPPAPMTWKPYNFRGVPQASEESSVTLPAYMNRGSENNFFIAKDGRFIAFDVNPPGQSGFVAPDGTASKHDQDQLDLYKAYETKKLPFTLDEIKAAAVSSTSLVTAPLKKDNPSIETKIKTTLKRAHESKHLGAFITIADDSALSAASKAQVALESGNPLGALNGIPFVVKDNIHVAGMPNTAGTLALKDFVPQGNNLVVQRLLDAGAIMVGKTNMHELAFGITSNNAAFGAVKNAHDPSRIAGGSSGGTAVAIAAGVVEMGLGTDTGGSTRIPPSLNGIVGFRPSMGRYPAGDVTPVAQTRDTVGPIANNVTNLALMDCVITDCQTHLKPASLDGLRLGIPRDYFYHNLSEDVNAVMQKTIELLSNAGVVMIDVEMPNLKELNDGTSFPVALYEFMRDLPLYLDAQKTGISMQELVNAIASPDVKSTILSQLGEDAMPESAYLQAIDEFRPKLQALYQKTFADYNVAALLVPTTVLSAQAIKTSDQTVTLNGEQVPTFVTYIQNADPSSNAGIPSLTIPAGKDRDNLPIGMMLDGPVDSDRQLLSIALAIEAIIDSSL